MTFEWPWKPKPVPQPKPETPPANWLQAWLLLRKIPLDKIFPALSLMSVVLFFAVSGVVSWIVVMVSFVMQLFRVLL